jgi:hypothetical protein
MNDDERFTPATDAETTVVVRLPSFELPVATKNDDRAPECAINNLEVFVLEADSLLYHTAAVNIESSGLQTTCKLTLKQASTARRLVMVANTGALLNTYNPPVGTTLADLKAGLVMAYTAAGVTAQPMYGEVNVAAIPASGLTLNVRLLRALARADVRMSAAARAKFQLKSVRIYRAANRAALIPDAVASLETAPVVSTPTVAASTGYTVNANSITAQGDTASIAQLYLPERPEVTGTAKISAATCIVIGGLYNGAMCYYRLDFDPAAAGHPFGQILRNHLYRFVIKNIYAAGYATPDAAASSVTDGVNASLNVIRNTEWLCFNATEYLGVSETDHAFSHRGNQIFDFGVETSFADCSIIWKDDFDAANYGAASSSLQNAKFSIEIAPSKDYIRVTTLTDNRSVQDINRADFVVMAGQWAIPLTATQGNISEYLSIRIKCYSGNGYGDYDPSHRFVKKLTNAANFGASGVVPFGGFLTYFNSPSWGDVFDSYSAICKYDVIWLVYNETPSNAQCNRILQWLRDKPNRILIVNFEDDNVQGYIRQQLGDNLTWNYHPSTVSGSYFTVPPHNAANRVILEGPFGNVTAGKSNSSSDRNIKRNDDIYASAVVPPNSDIITVLTDDNGDMVVGINPTKQVIYLGDGDLMEIGNGGLTDNSGYSNDIDRLVLNLYAWIANTILENSAVD